MSPYEFTHIDSFLKNNRRNIQFNINWNGLLEFEQAIHQILKNPVARQVWDLMAKLPEPIHDALQDAHYRFEHFIGVTCGGNRSDPCL